MMMCVKDKEGNNWAVMTLTIHVSAEGQPTAWFLCEREGILAWFTSAQIMIDKDATARMMTLAAMQSPASIPLPDIFGKGLKRQ